MKDFLNKVKAFCQEIIHKQNIFYKKEVIAMLIAVMMIPVLATTVPTLARYFYTLTAPFFDDGEEKDHLDFTVNTVFVVDDQNDLFSAINQGYSYIQISNELTNPFVITQSPKNLTTDLIIDLNGIELYRHGNEPIFEVSEGVRLTITDTSETQRGCLYNPTGSVLKIDGGTLTVVSGKFECGPRYSEYYTYNNHILSSKSQKRTIIDEEPHLVTMYTRVGEGKQASFAQTTIYAPIIEAYDTSYDGNTHHHGNMYFDWEIQVGNETDESKNFKIQDDTYCYYTTTEDDSYEIMSLTAYQADWYYTYNVDPVTYKYTSVATEDTIEVTVYGYEGVIENAETRADSEDIDKESNNFFAAIKMYGGVFDILYGDFYNYFGVNTTACIDMMGGELIIKQGNFSTRIPNASSHAHNMVDAKEDDAEAFDPFDYFNDFHWGKENFGPSDPVYDTYKDGTRASKGEGFGILTSGDAKITIGNGQFFSSNNNLIHMQNGVLNIGGGDFYKVNTQLLTGYSHNDTAIFMHDGELRIDKANYVIYGDYARAIRMIDGKLDINGASCIVHGDYSYAVYSSIPGNNLNLTDIKFTMHARTEIGRIVGIYSIRSESGESGTVSVHTSEGEQSFINIEGPGSVAIYTSGGDVYSQGCDYEITGINSSGIYSDEGRVEIYDGQIKLNSNINCYGIYAISKSESVAVQININHATIDVGYVDSATPPTTVHSDCKACIGVFLASANPDSSVTLNNSNVYSYEVGLALSGGNLLIKDSDDTPNAIKTNRASAVAVSNGDLVFEANGTYNLTSYNTTSMSSANSYDMTIPYLSKTNGVYSIDPVAYRNTDGVYVNGGSLDMRGMANITHTGLDNGEKLYNGEHIYNSLIVNSYAIRVTGGSVTISKANITAHAGGGIYCSGGDITMGNASTVKSDITLRTNGCDLGDDYDSIGTGISTGWKSKENINGGHAIELNGGDITIYNGTYTAMFGNGVAANGSGTITIYNGTFEGWMTGLSDKSGPAAYYGLKVIGGATVNIYGGSFTGGNGGAFVTGIDQFVSQTDIRSTTGKNATVYVYAGTFGDKNHWDGFNVYDMSTVVFGAAAEGSYSSASQYQNAIKVSGNSTGIAANKITNGSTCVTSQIYVYYGTYEGGTNHGSCYNNDNFATLYLYNQSRNYTSATGSNFTRIDTSSPTHHPAIVLP